MAEIKATALIVDDEKDIRELIEMSFASLGIDCILSPTIKDALKNLKKQSERLDFCITDMRLPDGDGLELVAYIQRTYPDLPVCIITAHGNVELAVKALKNGAFDFVNKPFDLKQLRGMAKAALKLSKKKLLTQPTTMSEVDERKAVNIIGDSAVMKRLAEIITKLARSQAPVFIQGESGTGKELVAKSIHQQSARRDGEFIAVNCGAIPETLVESEFFGYKKGAFTGANTDQDGLFVAASGGTLFLDEVADLPLAMQVKLLRAIQERAIRPVGGDKEIAVDVRILSATHKNLAQLVADGEFREDLYYRLNVISLGMPPLRKRHGDIAVLSNFILKKIAARNNFTCTLTDKALAKLNHYDFPGNVRELENILERAVTFCVDGLVDDGDIHFSNNVLDASNGMNFDLSDGLADEASDASHLNLPQSTETPQQLTKPSAAVGDLNHYLADIEKNAIADCLKANNNDKKAVAEQLGLSLSTLRNKIKKYEL